MKEDQFKFKEKFQIDYDTEIEIDGVTYGPFGENLGVECYSHGRRNHSQDWSGDPMLGLLAFFIDGGQSYNSLNEDHICMDDFKGYLESQLEISEEEIEIPHSWPVQKVKKKIINPNGLNLGDFYVKAEAHQYEGKNNFGIEAIVSAEERDENKCITLEYKANLGDPTDLGEEGPFGPYGGESGYRSITEINVSVGAKNETDFVNLRDRVKTILRFADLYWNEEKRSKGDKQENEGDDKDDTK